MRRGPMVAHGSLPWNMGSKPSGQSQNNTLRRHNYKPTFFSIDEESDEGFAKEGDFDQVMKNSRSSLSHKTSQGSKQSLNSASSNEKIAPTTKSKKPSSYTPKRPHYEFSEEESQSSETEELDVPKAEYTIDEREAYAETAIKLIACPVCNRKFAADRIATHRNACKKANKRTRPVYNATTARLDSEALKLYKQGEVSRKKEKPKAKTMSKWKVDHEYFMAIVRANKGPGQTNEDNNSHSFSGDKTQPVSVPLPIDPSLVQCPHCLRRFNAESAAKHIPKCVDLGTRPVRRASQPNVRHEKMPTPHSQRDNQKEYQRDNQREREKEIVRDIQKPMMREREKEKERERERDSQRQRGRHSAAALSTQQQTQQQYQSQQSQQSSTHTTPRKINLSATVTPNASAVAATSSSSRRRLRLGEEPERHECPHCHRKFEISAFLRHTDICKNVAHKPEGVTPSKDKKMGATVTPKKNLSMTTRTTPRK